MKKQLNQLRRFFSRTGTRKLNAATAREVIPASYDDDDGSNRLSGAFVVVLLLHIVALVGVVAASKMKDPKAEPTAKAQNPAAPKADPKVVPASAPIATAQPLVERAPVAESAVEPTPAEPVRAAAPVPVGRRTHTVRSGENLTRIALSYGVVPTDLMAANGLKSDDIKSGQLLVIPEAKPAKQVVESKPAVKPQATVSKATSYTVRKGDTLVKIARILGVSYDDLAKVNSIKDPRKIQEGQVLKVPRKS